jgi:hypothetical protein
VASAPPAPAGLPTAAAAPRRVSPAATGPVSAAVSSGSVSTAVCTAPASGRVVSIGTTPVTRGVRRCSTPSADSSTVRLPAAATASMVGPSSSPAAGQVASSTTGTPSTWSSTSRPRSTAPVASAPCPPRTRGTRSASA